MVQATTIPTQMLSISIRPELIDCDMYRFLDGDEDAINAYFGEYMSQYPWAVNTEAQLLLIQRGRQ